MVPNPTWIYHFTHYENLSSILEHDGLHAVKTMHGGAVSYRDIAYSDVQDKRANTIVPVEPRGVLHDYVPFYFAPRSPMLYTIHRGNVPQHKEGQEPLIYLVSTVQCVVDEGLPFVFTEGHGIMKISRFFNDENQLDNVDWQLMKSQFWNDTDDDPDRKRRRQAEFLVYEFFPWTSIIGIGTYDEDIKAKVENMMSNKEYKPQVKTKRQWYY